VTVPDKMFTEVRRSTATVFVASAQQINVGQQQFHMPTREKPQVLRGAICIVMPDLEALKQR
jgi:hypothetical protein